MAVAGVPRSCRGRDVCAAMSGWRAWVVGRGVAGAGGQPRQCYKMEVTINSCWGGRVARRGGVGGARRTPRWTLSCGGEKEVAATTAAMSSRWQLREQALDSAMRSGGERRRTW